MKVWNNGRVKMWTDGVPVEDQALEQVQNVSNLPFVHKHVAIMPDVHWGHGATIGSVIPTVRAIIPAAVGVDLGCGMQAVRTTLKASNLPDNLHRLRSAIEQAVPHGWSRDQSVGAWTDDNIPDVVSNVFRGSGLADEHTKLVWRHPRLQKANTVKHLGTLGSGNHFVEICLDESQNVWVMLHSGSRGIGNLIGRYFIELAKKEMERWFIHLPDADLAYLPEGSEHFWDYVYAVEWAQRFAALNRHVMMVATLDAIQSELGCVVDWTEEVVDCHHNYVARERHYGETVWVTRKGAVRAAEGVLGIIPGAMGRKSFIVRGKGNREAFESCSHGAGRAMSRNEAKKRFTIGDHVAATEGVECLKDESVLDETPGAYKDIDAVMAAQSDLVDIVHTLKAVLCVKGA